MLLYVNLAAPLKHNISLIRRRTTIVALETAAMVSILTGQY